jgi:hypothetical protein
VEQSFWRIDEGGMPGCPVGTVISLVAEGSSAAVMRDGVQIGTLSAATTQQTGTSGNSITLTNQTEGWRAVLSRQIAFSSPAMVAAPGPGKRSVSRTKLIVGVVVVLVILAAIGEAAAGSKPSVGSGAPPAPTPTPATTGSPFAPSSAPSAPPSSAPSSTPISAPVAAFKPIVLSGRGAKVPKFTIPEGAAAIATISAKGSDNFAVTSLAADGSDNELLVNVIGGYSGTVLFDSQNDEHSVAFRIETTDSWTITIKPVASARTWDGASRLSGKGDDVVEINPPSSGLVTLNITNKGQDNFVVTGYSDNGTDLMVNEIGNYTGQIPLADGSFLLGVQSDGAWTVAPGG